MFCTNCGKNIAEESRFCPACGASFSLQNSNVSAPPTYPSSNAGIENTSGMGKDQPIPDGVTGWSTGAFVLNWIWSIFNKTWIGLICLVPLVGPFMALYLGFDGRKLAWQNKRWDSVEHFNKVQKKWSVWALVILAIPVFFIAIAIILPMFNKEKNSVLLETTAQESTPSQTDVMEQPAESESASSDSPSTTDNLVVPEGADPERWAAADAQAKEILAEGNAATQFEYTSGENIAFIAKKTPDGFVFESSNEIIYVGNLCDAFSKTRGTGKWFWANGGVSIEFNDSSVGFPRQETPFEDSRCRL